MCVCEGGGGGGGEGRWQKVPAAAACNSMVTTPLTFKKIV